VYIRSASGGLACASGGPGLSIRRRQNAMNQTLYRNPPYRAATDFTPVALFIEQPVVLIARHDLPAGNLPEFTDYAKANQAKMQYGSAGVGSAPISPVNC
jgi:tripartite-type tricarboxylate transporter receptor subunit TctC